MDFHDFYNSAGWELNVPFIRMNSLPIDKGSLFPSLAAAIAYASKDSVKLSEQLNNDIKSSYTSDTLPIPLTPYAGQFVHIIGEDSVDTYVITKVGDGTLNSGKLSKAGGEGIRNGDNKCYFEYDSTLEAVKLVFI